MAISQTNENIIIFAASGDKIDRKLYLKKLVVSGITSGGALVITDYASSMYLFNETVGTNATTGHKWELDFPRRILVSGIKAGTIPTGGTLFAYIQ